MGAARILAQDDPISILVARLEEALAGFGPLGIWLAIAGGIALSVAISAGIALPILRTQFRSRPLAEVPWGSPDAVLVFFLLLSFLYLISFSGGDARPPEPPEGESRIPAILGDIAFQILFAGGIAGLAAIRLRRSPAADLGLLRPLRLREAGALAGLLIAWIPAQIGSYLGWLCVLDRIGVRFDLQTPIQILRDGGTAERSLVVIFAVALAPVCEETVFRGYLHGGLRRVLGRGPSLFMTAALFALFHHHLPVLLPIFLLGLLLGLLYERSGSLWAPIGFHALFNAGNVALSLLSRDLQ